MRDEAVLLELLRVARRRHRMLPLPRELDAAVAAGSEATLAFTLEAARRAMADGAFPPAALRDAFVGALAALLRRAAAPGRGDPLFQAQLLRASDLQVRAWARLEVLAARDAREVRSVVDAIAHPGKLRGMPDGPRRRALVALHARSVAGEWDALASEALSLLPSLEEGEERLRAGLRRLSASDALQRLGRQAALSRLDAVRAYRTLRAGREASAGSDAALGQGRAAAREGLRAEDAAARALGEVATLLNAVGPGAYRVFRSLLTPPGLAGGAERAKTEWDAAIVRQDEAGTHDVVLLAEAKAQPAAATADLSRLLRGLALLAQAPADVSYAFAAAEGAVQLGGASLRALQPQGAALPRQVVYICPAAHEDRPAMLDPAARATLMSQPASLRYAAACVAGASPADDALVPVWEGVTQAPRLRAVLHQYDTACRAREAMLHPDDLSAAVAELRARLRRLARQP